MESEESIYRAEKVWNFSKLDAFFLGGTTHTTRLQPPNNPPTTWGGQFKIPLPIYQNNNITTSLTHHHKISDSYLKPITHNLNKITNH